MATFLSQLPSDLRNVIKAVNKKATAGNQGTSLTASSDKLWLFAAAELWSKTAIENSALSDLKNNAAAYNGEGTQYEYFKNTVGVYTLGDVGIGSAGGSYGVCFGFCV